VVFGCFPRLLTDKIGPSVENIVSTTAARPDAERTPQAAVRGGSTALVADSEAHPRQ